jgi:hypothetical protein
MASEIFAKKLCPLKTDYDFSPRLKMRFHGTLTKEGGTVWLTSLDKQN